MYLRDAHAEKDKDKLCKLVKEYPLGVLTTFVQTGADDQLPALQHTHIPWTLDVQGGAYGQGILRGHLARANPHAKQLLQAAATEADRSQPTHTLPSTNVTVMFTHAVQAYVTPRYYTHTKPANGKVVPTYDYAAVEVRGPLRVHQSGSAFLDRQIRDLTRELEPRSLRENDDGKIKKDHVGWNVSDAPASYIDILKRAIVGVEIDIETMVGKFKMSQELDKEDRQGVVDGFASTGTEAGQQIASIIQEKGDR